MKSALKAVFVVCFFLFSNVPNSSREAKAQPLVFMPFAQGESWYCTQGQGGTFSHTGNQYYGFDFYKGSNINNATNPAYGRNLYSPVNGEIVEIRDGVTDFQNNAGSNAANNWGWGNTIVIEDEEGIYYIRLAHMKANSTDHLDVGDWVDVGDYLGKVGSTGYSTAPHLHMQVMVSSMGVSQPFMFVEGNVQKGDWVKSSLMTNASVLDNNGSTNLSNDFTNDMMSWSGTWTLSTSPDWYAGYNYRRHKWTGAGDTATLEWNFSVGTSGFYNIFASFPVAADNEPLAQYWFGANNPGTKVKTMDQSVGTEFMRWVTGQWLNKGTNYVMRLKGKTLNKYVIADAIILRRM